MPGTPRGGVSGGEPDRTERSALGGGRDDAALLRRFGLRVLLRPLLLDGLPGFLGHVLSRGLVAHGLLLCDAASLGSTVRRSRRPVMTRAGGAGISRTSSPQASWQPSWWPWPRLRPPPVRRPAD